VTRSLCEMMGIIVKCKAKLWGGWECEDERVKDWVRVRWILGR
jgi:hypothetical protein